MAPRVTRLTLLCALLLCIVCIATAVAATANVFAAATTATTTAQMPTDAEADARLRALRQELDSDTNAKKQLKQEPDDEGDDAQLPGGDIKKQSPQQTRATGLETPLEKSTGRPITRVYDPITGLFCELEGDCHACPVSEKDEAYCRETGNRQEMRCPRSPETTKTTSPSSAAAATKRVDTDRLPEIRFKACVPLEKANPFTTVVWFELVMAGVFAGAFALLRKEQQKHVSAFDLRKDPRQRSSLLGSSSSSQKGAD